MTSKTPGARAGARLKKVHMALHVNGETQEVAFAPHKTLLEVLREDMALTGTKHGCELGECGTCTVIVDGEPVLSCLMLGLECDGVEIDRRRARDRRGPAPAPDRVRRPKRRPMRILHAGIPLRVEGASR